MTLNTVLGILCIIFSLGAIFIVGFSAGFHTAVDFIKNSKENEKHDSN